jgi:ABC-type antimicrobial peptide transport system ATPase subunit
VPTIKVPERVEVEIPVPCIPASQRPQKPALRTADELMAMDEYSRTLGAWSELEKLWGYAPALEALVEGCSRLPP